MTARVFLVSLCLLVASLEPAYGQIPRTAPPAFPDEQQQAPVAQPRTPAPPGMKQPAPGGEASTPPAAPVTLMRRDGQPINVRVELTITDQRTGSAPVKKTVSVVVADGQMGFIRSQSEIAGIGGSVPLNVDAEPSLLTDGKIRLRANVQYDLPATPEALNNATRGTTTKTAIHETLSLILENGKPLVAAQSADPVSDRTVTVEVKATVLK